MKTLKNMKLVALFASFAYTAVSMGMGGLLGGMSELTKQIDVNSILNQASSVGAQVPENLDINAIKSAIEAKVHNIPSSLLGVNLRTIDASNIDYAKAAIAQAKMKLPMVIGLLQFPNLIIQAFEEILLPKLQMALAQDPAGQSVLAPIRSAINLAKSNPAMISAVSSRIAALLTTIKDSIQNLDLNNINPAVLASAMNYMLNKYEGTFSTSFPIISGFIDSNKDAIKNLVGQIKAMNLNINTQQLIERAKNEAAGAGINLSTFGL